LKENMYVKHEKKNSESAKINSTKYAFFDHSSAKINSAFAKMWYGGSPK